MKYVAIKNHRSESDEVLIASTGDELSFERRETIYQGWIWCTDLNGIQAWVPETYVSISGDSCRMIRDYISRELDIDVGDKVEVLEIESSWAWVLDRHDKFGWIPMECIEPLDSPGAPG